MSEWDLTSKLVVDVPIFFSFAFRSRSFRYREALPQPSIHSCHFRISNENLYGYLSLHGLVITLASRLTRLVPGGNRTLVMQVWEVNVLAITPITTLTNGSYSNAQTSRNFVLAWRTHATYVQEYNAQHVSREHRMWLRQTLNLKKNLWSFCAKPNTTNWQKWFTKAFTPEYLNLFNSYLFISITKYLLFIENSDSRSQKTIS